MMKTVLLYFANKMKIKIVIPLLSVGLSCIVFRQDTPAYRIEVTKDTIYIGEPIIVKCKLINKSSTAEVDKAGCISSSQPLPGFLANSAIMS